ncbi:271_t:CDS:2, partial [Paraglomus occultum]
RTDHDASASRSRQPSRPSVRQTSSDASSQASTSRPTTTAKPPPTKKKQSLYDMLRAENFTDPLLGLANDRCDNLMHLLRLERPLIEVIMGITDKIRFAFFKHLKKEWW